jgi:predicted nucleic acid-binding protein
VFGGKPRRVVRLAEASAYVLMVSQVIQDETERILLEKFRWSRSQVYRACIPIWHIARIITPEIVVAAAQDPDDNRILECALEARAVAIVTGTETSCVCTHTQVST